MTAGGQSFTEADTKRHIPRGCIIAITICDSHDAPQKHPWEIHRRIQTQ